MPVPVNDLQNLKAKVNEIIKIHITCDAIHTILGGGCEMCDHIIQTVHKIAEFLSDKSIQSVAKCHSFIDELTNFNSSMNRHLGSLQCLKNVNDMQHRLTTAMETRKPTSTRKTRKTRKTTPATESKSNTLSSNPAIANLKEVCNSTKRLTLEDEINLLPDKTVFEELADFQKEIDDENLLKQINGLTEPMVDAEIAAFQKELDAEK